MTQERRASAIWSLAGATVFLALLAILHGLKPEIDPSPPPDRTLPGKLHNVGGTLGIAMPLAALFVTWALARNTAWSWARRRLWLFAGLAFIVFLGAFVSLGVMLSRSGGRFGPDVPVGWPNRVEVAAYAAWVIVVASTLMRGERP